MSNKGNCFDHIVQSKAIALLVLPECTYTCIPGAGQQVAGGCDIGMAASVYLDWMNKGINVRLVQAERQSLWENKCRIEIAGILGPGTMMIQ
jgi:hypothetical protein